MRLLQAILAIARTQARDSIRAPVTLVVLVAALLLTIATPELAVFTLGRGQAFVLDLGASTVLVALLFLAATAGALGTAERVQDGTALLVLSRTRSSAELVVGTFLGVGAVLGLGAWLLALALVFATAPWARSFWIVDAAGVIVAIWLGVKSSRSGRAFAPVFLIALAVAGSVTALARLVLVGRTELFLISIEAPLLALLAGLAYAALGIALGTRLPPALAASATLGAAILGAAADGLASGPTGERAISVLTTLIPDLSLFSVAEAAYGDRLAISSGYLLGTSAWTAVYAAGALALGAFVLGRRELG